MMLSREGKWLAASGLVEISQKLKASRESEREVTGVRASEVRTKKKTKERCQRTSVENNASCTCKLLWASKEMWGVWLLLFWVPALLMSLSGPVSAARTACVPSRPQTAVISPVMACHRARLAWHTGEISNIHLLWLLHWLKLLFCEAFI